MIDLSGWLDEMAARPLPAAVSAAALAAAMGAALVAKAVTITLRCKEMDQAEEELLRQVAGTAGQQREALLHLVEADTTAFAAVLHGGQAASRQAACRAATECPLAVAEASRTLLDRLEPLAASCWPAVRTDLEVARWLLQVGVRAGRSAAKNNLRTWSDMPGLVFYQLRTEALEEGDRG
jgi:formiminotetrahydrofolate cyclodeaminase